jgi:hypothetical protein
MAYTSAQGSFVANIRTSLQMTQQRSATATAETVSAMHALWSLCQTTVYSTRSWSLRGARQTPGTHKDWTSISNPDARQPSTGLLPLIQKEALWRL